jgi:hypothetical protein
VNARLRLACTLIALALAGWLFFVLALRSFHAAIALMWVLGIIEGVRRRHVRRVRKVLSP